MSENLTFPINGVLTLGPVESKALMDLLVHRPVPIQPATTVFEEFPKIPRVNRDIVVTEKLDGTNAQIIIDDDGLTIAAASRSRLIFPGKQDNYGFAGWVQANVEELRKLGPGRHFGEWWGSGVNRGYGLTGGEKRFSLFQSTRWADPASRPACCGVVPILYEGPFDSIVIRDIVEDLRNNGSQAMPGFMNPEGIIVFHTASRGMFKVTCRDDEKPKGQVERGSGVKKPRPRAAARQARAPHAATRAPGRAVHAANIERGNRPVGRWPDLPLSAPAGMCSVAQHRIRPSWRSGRCRGVLASRRCGSHDAAQAAP